MKAEFEVVRRAGEEVVLRMRLVGEWPVGWAVPYADLDGAGLVGWFATAPAEGEGLLADRSYRLVGGHTDEEYVGFVRNLGQLVGQVKPAAPTQSGARFVYVEDYGG